MSRRFYLAANLDLPRFFYTFAWFLFRGFPRSSFTKESILWLIGAGVDQFSIILWTLLYLPRVTTGHGYYYSIILPERSPRGKHCPHLLSDQFPDPDAELLSLSSTYSKIGTPTNSPCTIFSRYHQTILRPVEIHDELPITFSNTFLTHLDIFRGGTPL